MKNKLIAIWNVFDGEEILPYSVNNIKNEVDVRIAVVQSVSNRGEEYTPSFEHSLFDYVVTYEPNLRRPAYWNEREKRQKGIDFAKTLGGTHYILLDCDEVYHEKEFARLKKIVYASSGYSVCRMRTYYGSPTQRIEPPESYFVPFINKLTPLTKVGFNPLYGVECDPTRMDLRMTKPRDLTIFQSYAMNHYSWVRKDLALKLRNSSSDRYAKNAEELAQRAKNGELVHFSGRLVECENLFNIEL